MPKIYRIRFIPYETVDISSDRILFRDDRYLVTSWKPIHPRDDIGSGSSLIFLEEGWKISAVRDGRGQLKYWYCDIVDVKYDENKDTFYLYDLLTDIIIGNSGSVEVRDLDELAAAFEQNLITKEQLTMSLVRSNRLLGEIYSGKVPGAVAEILGRYADGG